MKKKSNKTSKPHYPTLDHQASRMLGWVPPTYKERAAIQRADQQFKDAIAKGLEQKQERLRKVKQRK